MATLMKMLCALQKRVRMATRCQTYATPKQDYGMVTLMQMQACVRQKANVGRMSHPEASVWKRMVTMQI